MGYPEFAEERDILDRYMENDPLEELQSVIAMEEILYVQSNYTKVHVSQEIKNYILELVSATRKHRNIELGCSPRASLNLMKGSQALAAVRGRDYVIPEDIKELAVPILSHRLILKNDISGLMNKPEDIIADILNTIHSPLEEI
jgi:MoxR-like ATPase